MVRFLPAILVGVLLGAVAACARYEEPIALPPYGAAVRANMAAMIIDPTPSTRAAGPMDAERALGALERYRTNSTEPLGNVSTAPSVVVAPQ